MTESGLEGQDLLVYGQRRRSAAWLAAVRGRPWTLVCTLGFTETALIPGISAAGKTPADRRWTAIADAEFLLQGLEPRSPQSPSYPLPPLTAGLSPVLITRALVEAGQIPIYLLNAGLPLQNASTGIDLGGRVARCVSTGQALPRPVVEALLQAGLDWGDRLAHRHGGDLLVLGECVVGGTTTALGILTGLGIAAQGRVNSSHRRCNHEQKQTLVNRGLQSLPALTQTALTQTECDPLDVVAAVGDPMQIVVAGLAIAASRHQPILLAGGTQMLAVYALAAALCQRHPLPWQPDQIAVGTTRWVAADPSADTPGLAQAIGERYPPTPMLLATPLNFSQSRHSALRAYEAGFVKEGGAAGGSAIATALSQGLDTAAMVAHLDDFCDRYYQWRLTDPGA